MTKIKTHLFLGAALCAFAGFAGLAYVPSSQAEPLDAVVTAALNHHPSVEAALAARDSSRAEKAEYVAGYFPTLDVRSTGGRVYGDNATSRGLSVTRGAGYSWLWEGSVTLTQMLFDGNETSSRVQSAQARRMAANYNIMDVREKLALRTVLAYMDIVRGREAMAALQRHHGKVTDYIKRISKMVDEGAADEAMLAQARDIEIQLLTTMNNLQGQMEKSAIDYTEVVGRAPDSMMGRPVVEAASLPLAAEDGVTYAMENHPALLSASYTWESLEKDTAAARAGWYPDFNGELSYLKRDQRDIIGGEAVDEKAVVRMNWNFSTGGAQKARVRKAEYKQQESAARYQEKRQQIEKMIRTAYNDIDTATRQLGLMGKRVDLNRALLGTYEAQFEGGRVTLLQLLQTENTLFNAELARLNGQYRFLAAQFSALASMAKLQDSLSIVPVGKHG